MPEKYVINGVEYDRFDDVPDQYKRQIVKMRAFGEEMSELGEIQTEFIEDGDTTTHVETITHTTVGEPIVSVEMDGKEVSLDDVPPLIRRKIERALEDKDGDGVPDSVQHLLDRPEPKNANPFDAPPRSHRVTAPLPPPVTADDGSYVSRSTWIALGVALVIVALAVGYWLGS